MGTAVAERRHEARPVCPRCTAEVDPLRWYCADCGGPLGACTTCHPFAMIPAMCEFLVRAVRVSLFGQGWSWPVRLGAGAAAAIFLGIRFGPVMAALLLLVFLRRRRG